MYYLLTSSYFIISSLKYFSPNSRKTLETFLNLKENSKPTTISNIFCFLYFLTNSITTTTTYFSLSTFYGKVVLTQFINTSTPEEDIFRGSLMMLLFPDFDSVVLSISHFF